jgi:hypothetical protein
MAEDLTVHHQTGDDEEGGFRKQDGLLLTCIERGVWNDFGLRRDASVVSAQ